jgi:sarcosine/dimethylglycine N-methyltransferase
MMCAVGNGVTGLYEAHPITEDYILTELRKRGNALDDLSPEDLFPFDQDHYGGSEATETLGECAGLRAGNDVLDLCSGLGGPARYLAWRFACRVTGIDLTGERVRTARNLTDLVGLSDQVSFFEGDVTSVPFPDASFDACLSQESFLHVADKRVLLSECRRVLRPGGAIAFSDWVAQPSLEANELGRLERAFHAPGITSAESYVAEIRAAGFGTVEVDDLSAAWRPIVRDRLDLLRSLREPTVERLGMEHFERWEREYGFIVGLVQAGKLGGARFVARSAGS